MFSDWRLKSLFVKEPLPKTCAQVRNYLVGFTSGDWESIARCAQAFGVTGLSARRHVANLRNHDAMDSKSMLLKPMLRKQVLSLDTSIEAAGVGVHDGGADVLLMGTGSTFPTMTASLTFTSCLPSSAQSPAFPYRKTRPKSSKSR